MRHPPALPWFIALALAGLTALHGVAASGPDAAPNTLTEAERAAGWRLLFDGRTTTGWRGFKKEAFPDKGWIVEDGCLRHVGKGGGGDIVTVETFGDYEFAFDWRINAGGNGGVKYFITEDRPAAIGHEYQLMGERGIEEARRDLLHATASFYAVVPVSRDLPLRAPDEWNHSLIVIRGTVVEHWLNGSRVAAYELGSEPVTAGIARSKFRNVPGFGTKFPHPLLLQDHGGDIRFRNLKLRPLPATGGR